jgi:RNA polymerase sigma-70 factor (ECF subfamily)
LSEPDLILRARQGDAGAWERLVREHQAAAFRLAYLIVGDSQEAEDAAQEAFVRAYRSLHRFDQTRPFRPWLLSITANLARNRLRSAARYLGALQRLVRLEPAGASAHGNGVSTAYAGKERSQLLWQAVRRLGEADQEIIYLRYFLEMPESETAQTLQVAPGTVKSRLHRALGRLRQVIERDYPTLRELVEE